MVAPVGFKKLKKGEKKQFYIYFESNFHCAVSFLSWHILSFIIFIFRFGPLILSDRTAVWTCSWWTVSYWPHAVHWVIWKEMFTTKNQTALVMLRPFSQTCFTAGISGKCFMHFVFCIKHILNMIIVSYDTLMVVIYLL